MGKQMLEVDVPKLPEGWEAIAVRRPVKGDYYWHDSRNATARVGPYDDMGPAAYCTDPSCDYIQEPRIILRPVWVWPAWLKAPWIAMDEGDPTWRAFLSEPCLNSSAGIWGKVLGFPIDSELFDFTPPPCTDWRQSKRKNPNP